MTGVHGQVLGHVVRRSVDALNNDQLREDGKHLLSQTQLPTWALVGIVVYGIFFALALSSIRYTIGDVIATLMMVETPQTETITTVPPFKDASDPDAPLEKEPLVDAETVTIKHAPVTRTARSTMSYMVSRAGFLSRWRGLAVSFVYHMCIGLSLSLVPRHNHMVQIPVSILATVLFSRLHMTWTHVLISAPTSKSWIRRIPSAKAGHNVLLPSAVYAMAQQLTIYMPLVLYFVLGIYRVGHHDLVHEFSKAERVIFFVKLGACALTGLFVAVMLLLPAAVTLTRIEASMLPEEDEALVPFDRSFGGRVVPAILGGTGCVGFLDAWRTVDRVVRLRIVKVYAQLYAMQFVIFVLGMIGLASFVAGMKQLNKA